MGCGPQGQVDTDMSPRVGKNPSKRKRGKGKMFSGATKRTPEMEHEGQLGKKLGGSEHHECDSLPSRRFDKEGGGECQQKAIGKRTPWGNGPWGPMGFRNCPTENGVWACDMKATKGGIFLSVKGEDQGRLG